MEILWTRKSQEDLADILRHLLDKDPKYFEILLSQIMVQATKLTKFPQLGRISSIKDIREKLVSGTSFKILYSIKKDAIVIYRILHTARGRLS